MKFAEKLAAHITPEWNSQYIKYDVNQIFNAILYIENKC
jgi:SPX domain protein involved in polyphosphate accumulation